MITNVGIPISNLTTEQVNEIISLLDSRGIKYPNRYIKTPNPRYIDLMGDTCDVSYFSFARVILPDILETALNLIKDNPDIDLELFGLITVGEGHY
jgi:hypothetical protein